jgi:hypothetical protein
MKTMDTEQSKSEVVFFPPVVVSAINDNEIQFAKVLPAKRLMASQFITSQLRLAYPSRLYR